jgi:MFS family permease
VIVSGLITTGWDLYGFYVPIYGHSIGLSASSIGNILGVFALATFVVRAILPRLTRRFGIEPVLRTAAFCAAVLFVPFALIQNVPVLFALSFGIGLALGCSQPLTLNLAYNYSPEGRAGEVTGLRLTITGFLDMCSTARDERLYEPQARIVRARSHPIRHACWCPCSRACSARLWAPGLCSGSTQ